MKSEKLKQVKNVAAGIVVCMCLFWEYENVSFFLQEMNTKQSIVKGAEFSGDILAFCEKNGGKGATVQYDLLTRNWVIKGMKEYCGLIYQWPVGIFENILFFDPQMELPTQDIYNGEKQVKVFKK